jgi:uncharacterized membrane protein SpoIIM required for sporulation
MWICLFSIGQVKNLSEQRYFSKPFILLLIMSAILIFVMLFFGGSQGNLVSNTQANQTQTQLQQMQQTATWLSLFLNNLEIALFTFIPLVGILWQLFVQFNTGFFVGSIAKAYGINYALALSAIIATPSGIVEYLAYIFALAESMMLVYCGITKSFRQRLFSETWKTLLIVTALLFVAAIIEASML